MSGNFRLGNFRLVRVMFRDTGAPSNKVKSRDNHSG